MASDELVSGKRLGRFVLIRRIALGGMAEIWLASHVEDDLLQPAEWRALPGLPASQSPDRSLNGQIMTPLVALKILLSPYAKDPTFHTMFVDEVRIASKLTHENIVHVYGAFELEGHLVQAMELVDGKDLRRVLSTVARAGERIPIPLALLIAREIARALAYAHMKRSEDGKPLDIVHRDVSPHNVMLTKEGGVKLLDFGIARAAERLTRTRTGVIKGKLSYMAPEQALGLPQITPRADIFAAGIVLWEMLAMQRLFKGDSDALILERVIKADVPPIRDVNPEVPQELATLLDQMLAQRPPVRPESMRVVENTLTRIIHRHYEQATSREALAAWVAPFLQAERTREQPLDEVVPAVDAQAPTEGGTSADSGREAAPAIDRTIAMRAKESLGASGSYEIPAGDAAAVAGPPEADPTSPGGGGSGARAEQTVNARAPESQVGIPTVPVRTRDAVAPEPPAPGTPTPVTPASESPTPLSETPTPVSPGEGSDPQRVRLPTLSEIHRAVDSVATVPMEIDPAAVRDLKGSVRVIDPLPRASARADEARAAASVTPITDLPLDRPGPADPTMHGDLAPGGATLPPKGADPTWVENTPGDLNFEPVPIPSARRASSSPMPVEEKEDSPPLVAPAPERSGERLYQVMLAAAFIVIAFLLVLLLIKE